MCVNSTRCNAPIRPLQQYRPGGNAGLNQTNEFPARELPAGNAQVTPPGSSDGGGLSSPDFGLSPSLLGGSPINVVEIDDFISEKDQPNQEGQFFNHGDTVANILQSGGTDKQLGQFVQIHKMNIDHGEAPEQRSGAISQALDEVIQVAQDDPSAVDVVNISQQDSIASEDATAVREKIIHLQNMGIPVVVAADNYGPQTPNQIAPRGAFVAASADQTGKLLDDSGPGNISAEARSTSFAAPQLAPLLGFYKSQGLSVPHIKQLMAQDDAFPGTDIPDVYT